MNVKVEYLPDTAAMYEALAAGEDDALAFFAPRMREACGCSQNPRGGPESERVQAWRICAARRHGRHSRRPFNLHRSGTMSMTASLENAAPRSSRAAQVAEIHLAGINASRTRCGLRLLSAAEAAREFADLDRLPQRAKTVTRRDAGNLMALRQGVPVPQAGIDAMHAEIVAKLNATLPARTSPSTSSPTPASRAPRGQAEVDAMHAEIAAKLNAEAGLKTPARHAR